MLTRTETEAKEQLEGIIADFEDKLRLAIDYESRAFRSIADERLLITTPSADGEDLGRQEEVLLGERMQAFQQVIEEKNVLLTSLWQEWAEVQAETICLAVEVLGLDVLEFQGQDAAVKMSTSLEKASISHRQNQQAYQKIDTDMRGLANSVNDATKTTLDTMGKQQKVGSHHFVHSEYQVPLADNRTGVEEGEKRCCGRDEAPIEETCRSMR